MKGLNSKRKQSGFTLIELLIVVIIVSILAAVVLPQFASSTDDASNSAWAANLATLRGAVDLYYQQHGEYPSANTASGGTCAGTAGTGAADSEAAFIAQLSMYTNQDGLACTTRSDGTSDVYLYGPYLNKSELPKSITGYNNLEVVTAGDLSMTGAADGTAAKGWKFDNLSGKLITDHVDYDNF